MRFRITAAVLCTMAFVATASAKGDDTVSWGKAGVPLAEYARDAAECAETSRYVTAYIEPTTLRQLDALSSAQLLDTVMQAGGKGYAMDIVAAITISHAGRTPSAQNTLPWYLSMFATNFRLSSTNV